MKNTNRNVKTKQAVKRTVRNASSADDFEQRNPLLLAVCLILIAGILLFVIIFVIRSIRQTSDTDNDPKVTLSSSYNSNLYLTLPDFSQITVASSDIDEAYNALETEIRLSFATYSETTDPSAAVALYDRVAVRFVGESLDCTVDDSVLKALSGELSDIVIGSGTPYPAFENTDFPDRSTQSFDEQLIGLDFLQSKEVTVTLPLNASASGVDITPLLGKRVRFSVTLTRLERAELPQLTDHLIYRYTAGDFSKIEDFRIDAIKKIRSEYAYLALYNAVSVHSLPEEAVNEEIVAYIQNIIMSEYDYTKLSDEKLREITDELRDDAEVYARTAVSQRMIEEALIQQTGTSLTESEYQKRLSEDFNENGPTYIASNLYNTEDLEAYYGKETLVFRYTVDKLIENAANYVRFTEDTLYR